MSAKNLKFSAARAAWPRAWVTGSPVSNVSSSAIRAARASMPSAIRFSMAARARPARRGQGPSANAARAAADGPVHVRGPAGRDRGVRAVGHRVGDLERGAVRAGGVRAADEVLELGGAGRRGRSVRRARPVGTLWRWASQAS